MWRKSHPRLSGRRKDSYNHGFTAREMETITSLCEALVPALDPSFISLPNGKEPTEAVISFFRSSASQKPYPDELAEVMWGRGLPEARIIVRAVLWLLATSLGTLLLCGALCFVGDKWPYFTKFTHLPVHQRERILQSWSKTRVLIHLKTPLLFCQVLVPLCLHLFEVDEKSNNPSWEAMDYHVDTSNHLRKTYKERALQNGLVETLYENPSTFPQSPAQKGLTVREEPQNNVYKIKCDAVIVGSGCGGGVAAAILANAGQKVVVIEKGNYYTATDYSSIEGPSFAELLHGGGLIPTTDASYVLMAGSTVGGGSAVNWSASIKTPKEVTKEWFEYKKLPLFGSSQYSYAMDEVCKRLGITDKCV